MKNILRSKIVLFATVLSGVAMAFAVVPAVKAANIEDCSANSIIKCGVSSPADLVKKIKANDPSDLKTIYNDFGLTESQYDNFAKNAKVGTANKNGTIVVDGQVVVKEAWSIGRDSKSYSKPDKIGSKTYYQSQFTDVFKIDSMPVFVMFNDKGQVSTAILQPCGNPVGGKNVNPAYECKQLNKTAVSGKANTYTFTTNAPATNGATVSKVVYDFGDGSAQVTKTKPSDAVTHTFSKSGSFTTKVTVYVKLPGGQEVAANGSGCATQITVKPETPPAKPVANWECTNLVATPQTQSDNSFAYSLRANASMTNATLISGDFDFGDGITTKDVKPASATDNNIATTHTYKEAKSYTAKATLNFKANDGTDAQGAATAATCQTTINITKPETPATPTPTPPVELPATGPVGVAGLFGGASILGTLGYRWRASRKLSKVDDLINSLRR